MSRFEGEAKIGEPELPPKLSRLVVNRVLLSIVGDRGVGGDLARQATGMAQQIDRQPRRHDVPAGDLERPATRDRAVEADQCIVGGGVHLAGDDRGGGVDVGGRDPSDHPCGVGHPIAEDEAGGRHVHGRDAVPGRDHESRADEGARAEGRGRLPREALARAEVLGVGQGRRREDEELAVLAQLVGADQGHGRVRGLGLEASEAEGLAAIVHAIDGLPLGGPGGGQGHGQHEGDGQRHGQILPRPGRGG